MTNVKPPCTVAWCDRPKRYGIGVCRWHGERGGRVDPSPVDRAAGARVAAESARRVLSERAAVRRAALIEDVEFLLSWGEHPERVAARVGSSLPVLYRNLQRWGRHDLARPFNPRVSWEVAA